MKQKTRFKNFGNTSVIGIGYRSVIGRCISISIGPKNVISIDL